MIGYAGSYVYFHGHPVYESSEGTICLVCGEDIRGEIQDHIDGCKSNTLTQEDTKKMGAEWEWIEKQGDRLSVDLSPERRQLVEYMQVEWEHLWCENSERTPELNAKWMEKNAILAHPYAQECHGTAVNSALWAFNHYRDHFFHNQAEGCFSLAWRDGALPQDLREMITAWLPKIVTDDL